MVGVGEGGLDSTGISVGEDATVSVVVSDSWLALNSWAASARLRAVATGWSTRFDGGYGKHEYVSDNASNADVLYAIFLLVDKSCVPGPSRAAGCMTTLFSGGGTSSRGTSTKLCHASWFGHCGSMDRLLLHA